MNRNEVQFLIWLATSDAITRAILGNLYPSYDALVN